MEVPSKSSETKGIEVISSPNIATEEENTLVELPITYTTNISYYFPYFYKTHLITFTDSIIDTSIYVTTCDLNCSFCDPNLFSKCMVCSTGFILNEYTCVDYCPLNYQYDILRRVCVLSSNSVNVVSTMAYSIGSCKNLCGRASVDCSCSSGCKARGDCCTDFDVVNCDALVENSLKVKPNECSKHEGCELCDNKSTIGDKPSCNQCKAEFFLYEGNCHKNCPEGSLVDLNNTCRKKSDCQIQNCESCANGNNNVCKQCRQGTYLSSGICVNSCPHGFRADRITWSCLEPPVFAWYWVFPSRGTCRNYCGVTVADSDCNCGADCFYFGNCCQDIEDYCVGLLFWRKNKNLKSSPSKSVSDSINKKLPTPSSVKTIKSEKSVSSTPINNKVSISATTASLSTEKKKVAMKHVVLRKNESN